MSARVFKSVPKWVLSIPIRFIKLFSQISFEMREMIDRAWVALIISRVSDVHDLLELYIYHYRNLPQQQTQEWRDERVHIIGGSEIATVLGNNKYSTMENLINIKLGLKIFGGNICTRWGTSFESVVVAILEREYNTKVMNTGSIGGLNENGVYIQTYSPDGLAIINGDIVLLEIKSPYSRIPSGIVPKEYMDQVLLGLGTIPVAKSALFVDACFRTCTYSEWDYNGVCNTRVKDIVFSEPIYLGFTITTTQGDGNFIREHIKTLISAPNLTEEKLIEDSMGYDVYQHFITHVVSTSRKFENAPTICDPISLAYPPTEGGDIYFTDKREGYRDMHIETIKEYFRKNMIITSITFWKLFYLQKNKVERDPKYMENVREPIRNVLHTIKSREVALRLSATS